MLRSTASYAKSYTIHSEGISPVRPIYIDLTMLFHICKSWMAWFLVCPGNLKSSSHKQSRHCGYYHERQSVWWETDTTLKNFSHGQIWLIPLENGRLSPLFCLDLNLTTLVNPMVKTEGRIDNSLVKWTTVALLFCLTGMHSMFILQLLRHETCILS